MGCDIHCYLEYKPKDSDRWRPHGGRINPGRNYEILPAAVMNFEDHPARGLCSLWEVPILVVNGILVSHHPPTRQLLVPPHANQHIPQADVDTILALYRLHH